MVKDGLMDEGWRKERERKEVRKRTAFNIMWLLGKSHTRDPIRKATPSVKARKGNSAREIERERR